MVRTFKEKDVGSGWPEEKCMTIFTKQKRLEVEYMPSKQEVKLQFKNNKLDVDGTCLWSQLLRWQKITAGLSKNMRPFLRNK
jgi:hypothetical protein